MIVKFYVLACELCYIISYGECVYDKDKNIFSVKNILTPIYLLGHVQMVNIEL
jgi:hypothetical protein